MISKKNFAIAAALSVLLAIFWQWRSGLASQSEAEKELYLRYVSGPLTDYCMALTRSLPILHGEKTPDLAEAEESADRSAAALEALLAHALPSRSRENMAKALALHQALAGRIKLWKHAKKKDWPELRMAEQESREKLLVILETQRYEASRQWRFTQTQQLEINALIYSLKELSYHSPL